MAEPLTEDNAADTGANTPAVAAADTATDIAPKKSALPTPATILTIDIGGTRIKALASGQTEARKLMSGKRMTPSQMVQSIRELCADWEYEAISIGYPGLVGDQGPRSEPLNLGPGWVGFDYPSAFGLPVRIINDAAMQALGSYEGGRMLFLGLGTGLGSALIAENVLVTLELGQIPSSDGRTLGQVLGRSGLERAGKRLWRDAVATIVPALMSAFVADYVVIGGGNAKELKTLPHGTRLGHNLTAFRGGFRLWKLEDVRTLSDPADHHSVPTPPVVHHEWRLL